MSLETARSAVAEFGAEYVSIGGGEPTLHPLFWQILMETAAKVEGVWLATNGSQTETALALAKLAQKGTIGCDLSQDEYHDPIDPRVVRAFNRDPRPSHGPSPDLRGVRNVGGNEINGGRCDFGESGCVCNDLLVRPDGTVRGCGCEDAPAFGNVNTGVDVPDGWEWGECHKDQESAA